MAEAPAENDLPASVASWVERSGRALELRVAREFIRVGGSQVDPSFSYMDLTSKVQREGDVLATHEFSINSTSGRLDGALRAVIECKSSAAKPWVAFDAVLPPNAASALRDWFVRSFAPWTGAADAISAAWSSHVLLGDTSPASHVVAANLGSAKSEEKNDANDAIRQALAAARAIGDADRERSNRDGGFASYVAALVVTAAPLFRCSLSEESGEVQLVGTDHFSVWGHVGGARHRVFVLNETRVADVAFELKRLATRVPESM